MKWVSPEECKTLLAENSTELIDVREPWEHEICQMGAVNIPMDVIAEGMAEFDKEKLYLIVCKTGRRAEAVANLLESDYGFKDISVLKGGITAWLSLTDPSFEIY